MRLLCKLGWHKPMLFKSHRWGLAGVTSQVYRWVCVRCGRWPV